MRETEIYMMHIIYGHLTPPLLVGLIEIIEIGNKGCVVVVADVSCVAASTRPALAGWMELECDFYRLLTQRKLERERDVTLIASRCELVR